MIRTLAALLLLASPAAAQLQCGPYDDVNTALTEAHGESPLVVAMSPQGVLVFYGNVESGSWTMGVVSGGQACIPAHGVGFEQFAPVPTGDPT